MNTQKHIVETLNEHTLSLEKELDILKNREYPIKIDIVAKTMSQIENQKTNSRKLHTIWISTISAACIAGSLFLIWNIQNQQKNNNKLIAEMFTEIYINDNNDNYWTLTDEDFYYFEN